MTGIYKVRLKPSGPQPSTPPRELPLNMADNVSSPNKQQKTAVNWMINDPKGGFQEHTLPSTGNHPQFVSISKHDKENTAELKKLDEDVWKTATIDFQVSCYCCTGSRTIDH